MLEGKMEDNIAALTNPQEDQISLQEVCVDLRNAGEVEVEKEQNSCSVAEVFNSSLDIDMITDYLMPLENNEENDLFGERNALEDVEHEVEKKVIELEKLVYTSDGVNNPPLVAANKDVEEGEISENMGIREESLGLLLEGDSSSKSQKMVEEQTFKDINDGEEFAFEENRDLDEKNNNFITQYAGSEMGRVVSQQAMKFEMAPKQAIEFREKVNYDFTLEARRKKRRRDKSNESESTAACPQKASFNGELRENLTKSKGNINAEEHDASLLKKRKRGPMTEGKREKKKAQKRAKRAEKNKQLGVRRLKLQPVLKPKIVSHCRHYLRGRCHEGDNCKFSHDIIPLTKKSVPCCHFVRQTCMKGDDCPFDHELSKYPCGNYTTKGSCSRGAQCVFSHQMPPKEGLPVTPSVSRPDLRSSPILGISDATKNVDARSHSIRVSPRRSSEQDVTPAAQKSTGVNFLFGKSSLGNTSLCKQAGSYLKADDGMKVDGKNIHSASSITKFPNDITKRSVGVAPRGINFLSFGKGPLEDFGSKDPSSVASNKGHDTGKFVFGGSSMDIQGGSSLKRNDGFKVDNPTRQSASDTVEHLKKMPKRSPAVAHSGVNFLSFGKASANDSSNGKQFNLPSNRENGAASFVDEKKLAPDKLQTPTATPWRLTYSSLPSAQSLGQSQDGHAKGNISLRQKLLQSNALSSAQKALPSNSTYSPQTSMLSNKPSSAPKALLSTLAFAAKYDSEIKMDRVNCGPSNSTDCLKEIGSSQTKPMSASRILDFLYGDGNKTKQ